MDESEFIMIQERARTALADAKVSRDEDMAFKAMLLLVLLDVSGTLEAIEQRLQSIDVQGLKVDVVSTP